MRVCPVTSLTRPAISIFHEDESSGGQFQNRNDRLPKLSGGLHSHWAIGRVFLQWGHGTTPSPDRSIHSPTALAIEAPNASSNVSIFALHEVHVNPSQTSPS